MKRRSIALIIGLMSFALLGVMGMQFYFLRQSYQMKSELFDRSVNEALNNVEAKITKQYANNFLNIKAIKNRLSQDALSNQEKNSTYDSNVKKNASPSP